MEKPSSLTTSAALVLICALFSRASAVFFCFSRRRAWGRAGRASGSESRADGARQTRARSSASGQTQA